MLHVARADVGILDGKIVAIGSLDEDAREEIDAAELILMPGVVDPHTHSTAQLFWDPAATPSLLHGVTTAINGNCGFTLAPVEQPDVDYLIHMMARVEGMSIQALEEGVPWNWASFGDYLDRLDGHLAVNAGFMIGLARYGGGSSAPAPAILISGSTSTSCPPRFAARSTPAPWGCPRRSRSRTPTAMGAPSRPGRALARSCSPLAVP